MARITQGAFNAGIISSGMYARSDTEKFQKGVADAVNAIVRPQGGLSNRAGTAGAARFDTSGADAVQWLIPFVFSTEQTYHLEFGESVFRVIRDGAYVLDTTVGALDIASISTAAGSEIELSDAGDAAALDVGNLVFISDPNGTHALHEAIVRVSAKDGADVTFEVFDGTELDTTSGDWGALGAGATLQPVYQQSHDYDLADLPKVRYAQDADVVYLAHPAYPPKKIGRVDNDEWTFGDVDFNAGLDAPANLAGTVQKGGDVNNSFLTSYEYVVASIEEETLIEGLPSAPVTLDNDLFYKNSINTLTWDAVAGASRYAVYRKSAGGFGYIGTTEDLTFADENITPDTATGPRLERDPFEGAGNYPSVVAFYEQRLAYGATDNDPQLVEMSRVGAVENFTGSYPALSDDAFRFKLRDTRLNRIRSFVPTESFTIITTGGEWEIAPQGDGDYLRPDRRKLAPRTNYGGADMPALFTGSVVVYIEPSGNVIRDYRPNDGGTPPGDLTVVARDLFEDREIVSWTFAAAPHKLVWVALDDGTLLSMTYMPEHDVWGWTRHEIAGTNARARQVSAVREGKVDALYVVVTREIGGVDVTMTERMADREDLDVTRAHYTDGGLRAAFDDDITEVGGLLHLRGEPVVALVDGDVVEDLQVDARGVVDLAGKTGQNVSVGLSYETLIRTLNVRMEVEGLGSSEGRLKSTSEIAVKLRRSRGVEIGTSLDRMEMLKEWEATMVGGPIPLSTHTPLYTVEGDWVRDATTYVRQRNPLPMTLLAISPEWEIGE